MGKTFDEISLQYWYKNRKAINSKSYSCFHNGYVYGDNMEFEQIKFIFVDGNDEIVVDENSRRKTYIKFVEVLCNESEEILKNYMSASAEKKRVYSEEQVNNFTEANRDSTRIKNENSAIVVNGVKYYVANNLKNSESFNVMADVLTDELRSKCYIRIVFEEKSRNAPIKEVDELQPLEEQSYDNFKLIFDDDDHNHATANATDKTSTRTARKGKVDYLSLGKKKKNIGDLGEYIVLEHEKQKLQNAGLEHLIEKIEHTAQEVGDNMGYDIKSFTEDGNELYIEVKSTQQNQCGGFYISQNEIDVANKMYEEGKEYRIYRLYNINKRKGEAHIRFYTPPFNDTHYSMKPISWYVEKENMID